MKNLECQELEHDSTTHVTHADIYIYLILILSHSGMVGCVGGAYYIGVVPSDSRQTLARCRIRKTLVIYRIGGRKTPGSPCAMRRSFSSASLLSRSGTTYCSESIATPIHTPSASHRIGSSPDGHCNTEAMREAAPESIGGWPSEQESFDVLMRSKWKCGIVTEYSNNPQKREMKNNFSCPRSSPPKTPSAQRHRFLWPPEPPKRFKMSLYNC